MVTLKVLPLPGVERTSMLPPMASARCLLMHRPRPVPPNLRVDELSTCVKGWKRSSSCSSFMPMPVSITSKQRRGEPFSPVKPDDEAHLAFVGELDRVADEIDQHLAQAERIGQHGFRQRADQLRLQPQLLRGGLRAHERDDFGRQLDGRTGDDSICTFSASIFDRSRMSPITRMRCSPLRRIVLTASRPFAPLAAAAFGHSSQHMTLR